MRFPPQPGTGSSVARTMTKLKIIFSPKVLLPVVIGVGLLVALLAFSGFQQAFQLIVAFQPIYLLYFFLAMVGYEIVRCIQWHYLLNALGIKVPLRTQFFTYSLGEATKNLPVGNFIPDYVLQRSSGTDFGRASSATLLITLIEVAVSLTGIVIIGIDGWTWLRPLILIGVFVFALLAWAFYRWHHASALHPSHPHHPSHAPQAVQRALRWKWVQAALNEVRQFGEGEKTLLHPNIIGAGSALGALYLLFSGFALYFVILGLGLKGISWEEAIVANLFSLAFAAIIPLPMDLGSTEVSGVGALIAMGLRASGAVSTLLLYRFLSLIAQLAMALLAIAVFPGEFRAALQARPRGVTQPAASPQA